MEYFILYLLSIVDIFKGIFLFLTIATASMFIVMKSEEGDPWADKNRKKCGVWFWIFLTLVILIPWKQDLCMIIGVGKTIEYIQSSDEIKELPDNAVKALNYYLEEITKEDKNHE